MVDFASKSRAGESHMRCNGSDKSVGCTHPTLAVPKAMAMAMAVAMARSPNADVVQVERK